MHKDNYILRDLKIEDASRMVEMMRDEKSTRYLRIDGENYTRESAVCFIEQTKKDKRNLHKAIVDQNDLYQGTVSLKNIDYSEKNAEYAIALHPDAQGKGIARISTESILHIAFHELHLNSIYLNVLEENKRAIRFYEKFGFVYRETTAINMFGEIKKLLWYYMDVDDKNEIKSVPKRKLVFFYRKEHVIAGSLIFFLSLAECISENLNYDVYYLNIPNKTLENTYASSKVKCLDVDACDYSKFEDAEFIVPVNYLPILLDKLKNHSCKKILLYDWHPDLIHHLMDQFYCEYSDANKIMSLFRETNSLAFMDRSCKISAENYSQKKFPPNYIPVFSKTKSENENFSKSANGKRFSIGWMSRLDIDKIYSLLNLLDNLKNSQIDVPIDVHIIGDGPYRNRINISQYGDNIRFIFTSYLYGNVRDNYIRENIDLMVVMGISAIDVSNLGIPVIIPMISAEPFYGNKYVYFFDIRDYSLGWNKNDFEKLDLVSHKIKEIIEQVRKDVSLGVIGKKCKEYAQKTFDAQKSCDLLLKALDQSSLTLEECMKNTVLSKQLKFFYMYKRIRPMRDYQTFIKFVQKLNVVHNKPLYRRMIDIPWLIFGPLRHKFNSCYTKLIRKIHKREKLRNYYMVQASYEEKIPAIQQIYAKEHKVKAVFFVIFSSVFPTRPIFERMLEEVCFDPYIMVTPDMQRSLKFKKETYLSTFEELFLQYGDRVIHGFDVENGDYTEPGDQYQLVFFNNPYSKMAHKYHHINYYLNKNALTLYVNYGFAAVKYGREIMKTDFYNYIWKVCLDSEINRKDLQRYEPIKGRNALVTGYIKMDGLSAAPVYSKRRKQIIISPHHTVLGWKSLDISNFMKYADLFIKLPRLYPNIDFVFRPHPLLFNNLVEGKIWSENQVKEYISHFEEAPNASYDHSGDYFELFANSDAMIHDCSSFIGEYLFTEKPCCYMLKSANEIKAIMNPMGMKCMEQYYKAFSENDILRFIEDVVLNGIDPLKKSREKFSREELKSNYPHATDVVLKTVKEAIGII